MTIIYQNENVLRFHRQDVSETSWILLFSDYMNTPKMKSHFFEVCTQVFGFGTFSKEKIDYLFGRYADSITTEFREEFPDRKQFKDTLKRGIVRFAELELRNFSADILNRFAQKIFVPIWDYPLLHCEAT